MRSYACFQGSLVDPVHLLWVKNRTRSGDRCQDPALDEYPHLSWPGQLHAQSEAKGSYLAGWQRGPDNRVQNRAWHPRAVPCRSALSPGGRGEEHGVLPPASQEQESLSLRTVSPLLGTVSLPEAPPRGPPTVPESSACAWPCAWPASFTAGGSRPSSTTHEGSTDYWELALCWPRRTLCRALGMSVSASSSCPWARGRPLGPCCL